MDTYEKHWIMDIGTTLAKLMREPLPQGTDRKVFSIMGEHGGFFDITIDGPFPRGE